MRGMVIETWGRAAVNDVAEQKYTLHYETPSVTGMCAFGTNVLGKLKQELTPKFGWIFRIWMWTQQFFLPYTAGKSE